MKVHAPQTTPAANPPLIEEPNLRQAKKRYADSFATFMAWMLWVYIWLPLVSLAAWALGFRQAWMHVFLAAHPSVNALLAYLAVTLLLGGGLILWGRYNYHRFRGVERRNAPSDAETRDMAVDFGIPEEQLRQLRASQRVALGIDDAGRPRELHLRPSVVEDDDGSVAAGVPAEAAVAG